MIIDRLSTILVTMDYSFQTRVSNTPILSPSRDEALSRLKAFMPKVPEYAAGRNFDRPGSQSVSEASPFLKYRLVTEREVVESVLSEYPYDVAEKFIQEICWRTYWKGYLEMRPGIWDQFKSDLTEIREKAGDDLNEGLLKARNGRTGITCFDEWVQQMVTTGWLHNHTRMWFASIWIFTLKLPWQAGAALFLEHLLDGDAASNTLSWRWVAGLHTRGKHYLARASNIKRYTDGRYDPAGQLDETAPSLDADGPYESLPFAKVDLLRDVQLPSLSLCPAGLLVTPDDLTPESGELSETPFSSIFVLSADDVLDSFNASDKVRSFCNGAVMDSAKRLAEHWAGKVTECRYKVIPMVGRASPDNVGRREAMRVYGGSVDRWVDGVLTWARNEHLKSIWYLRPPVGPWNDAIEGLKNSLQAQGVQVLEYRRRWDTVHWPHATAGYFRFKDGLQERLRRLSS